MKRFRFFELAMLVTLFVVLFSAVSFAQNGKTKIVFGHWGSTSGVWQQVADAFNAQSDTIEVEALPMGINWRELPEWLIFRTATGEAPDIVFISPVNYRDMYEFGLFMDLKPYIDQDSSFKPDIYFPAVMDWIEQNGKVYAFPSGMVSMVTFYNKQLFAEAGLPELPMKFSQEEALGFARALTKGEDQKGMGLMWTLERVFPWAWASGVDMFSEDGSKPLFMQEEWIRTMNFLNEAQRAYPWVRPGLLATDFRNYKLGFFPDGTWSYKSFSNALGDDLGVAPLPEGSAGYNAPLWPDSYAVPVGTKNAQAAWEVIHWFATEGSRIRLFPPDGTLGIPIVRQIAEEFVRETFDDPQTAATFMYNAQFGSIPKYPLNYQNVMREADAIFLQIAKGETAPRVGLEQLQQLAEGLTGKMPEYNK